LRELEDARAVAVAVAALDHPATQRAALDYLARFGNAQHAEAVVKLAGQTRSHEIVAAAVEALDAWNAHNAVARVQGITGVLLHWNTSEEPRRWKPINRADAEGRIELGNNGEQVAVAEVIVPEPTQVEFLAAASGAIQVRLNDATIHEGEKPARYQADSLRFKGELQGGRNRLHVRISAADGPTQFHLRFRRISSSAEHERLTQHLLQAAGNADRGSELFFKQAEKSLCTKCHRIGDQGARVGPDLTGIGSRFSRIHLIESILDPSRTIAPSYETIVVALTSGRTLSGVKIAEDENRLTLGDNEGRLHEIAKSEIEERASQTKSIMPDGLEKRLSDRELADLVAFLLTRKKTSEP
jgi:putative heme-binding domain-containing protein